MTIWGPDGKGSATDTNSSARKSAPTCWCDDCRVANGPPALGVALLLAAGMALLVATVVVSAVWFR